MYLRLLNHLPDRGSLRLDERLRGGHFDVFRHHAGNQGDIDANHLVDIQLYAGLRGCLKPRLFDRDVVQARLQVAYVVFALLVRGGFVDDVRLHFSDCYGCASKDSARSVANRSNERS